MQIFYRCMDQAIRVRLFWTLLMIFILVLPPKAFGDESFRCKGRIISIGDYKNRVLDLCGEPEHSEQWEEWYYVEEPYDDDIYQDKRDRKYSDKSRVRTKRLYRVVERWVYNFGPTTFKRYLYFRNDKLINIETGEKGKVQ